jgi:molybdopterin converting factor small subunit
MATVKFTSALQRFFPHLAETQVRAQDVKNLLSEIEALHPGIGSYLVDENGSLRQHVNIFLEGELIQDRKSLTDKVGENDEILIFQALSGG